MRRSPPLIARRAASGPAADRSACRLGLAGLEGLGPERVDHQRPDRRQREDHEQRREEHSVGEIRRQDHLEQREGDQQELGAPRPRVEELQCLGQDGEVGEGHHRQLTSGEEPCTTDHDGPDRSVQDQATALPAARSLSQQRGCTDPQPRERDRPGCQLPGDGERQAGCCDHCDGCSGAG
jgi:hypothetical protein